MSSSEGRIAKNTALLYLRMIIVILVNLYASRVILECLGVDDYGLYNVVGGIVSMFVFLNTAMVASSQRFITFEQGRSDLERQKLVFSTSVVIHFIIALAVVLLAETVGLWFLNHKMNIDPARMYAANWVYQSAIVCFVIKILIVPETSSVVAHERMGVYAVASIVFALLQLAAALCLYKTHYDRLITYSVLIIGAEAVNFALYKCFCRKAFDECRFSIPRDKALIKEMLSFAGWSFVGNFGIAMRGPGVNIVLNMFCGTAVNAARGIAYQVSSVVSNFVTNFQTALTPQITKRYASDERDSMVRLVFSGSRISFLLLAVIIVPLYIRAPYVLAIWLTEVPEMTVEFLRLVLVVSLIGSMVGPVTTALQATGNIKLFQIVIAVLMVLDLPLAFVLLKAGLPPYFVVFASVFTEIAALFARVFLLNAQVPIDVKGFSVNVILRSALMFALMFVLPRLIDCLFPQTFWGLIVICLISVIWSSAVILLLGIQKNERTVLLKFLRK